MYSSCSLLAQNVAGDNDALDFGGTLVDLGDLGITHHALDGVVTGVAVATEQLQACISRTSRTFPKESANK